jgi:hypothetical protein
MSMLSAGQIYCFACGFLCSSMDDSCTEYSTLLERWGVLITKQNKTKYGRLYMLGKAKQEVRQIIYVINVISFLL